MTKRMISLLLCAALVLGMFVLPAAAANNGVIGSLVDSYSDASGSFTLSGHTRLYIVCDGTPNAKLLETVQVAAANFYAAGKTNGNTMPIVYGTESGVKAGDIMIKQIYGLGNEGYKIDVTSYTINVYYTLESTDSYYGGYSYNGLHYGLQTLLKTFITKGSNTLNACSMTDAPDTKERVVQLDCARKYWSVEWIKNLIREMSWMGYNSLELHMTEDQGIHMNIWSDGADANGNNFSWVCGYKAASWASSYPDPNGGNNYTASQIRDIVATAKKYHIEIIPAVDVPGHCDYLIDRYTSSGACNWFSFNYNGRNYSNRPSKLYWWNSGYSNSSSGNWGTLDITNDYTKNLSLALIDGYAKFFKGLGCHKMNIGADEIRGTLNYTTFVQYINELSSMLRNQGYSVRAFNDYLYGNSSVALDSTLGICLWQGSANASVWNYLNDGHPVYNCFNNYCYYVLRYNSSGGDARDANNYWWGFHHSTEDRIYNEWNPSRMYAYNQSSPTINNVAGAYFLIWGDWAGWNNESQVWNGTDGNRTYNLIDRMWSNSAKMWNWDINNSFSYSSYASYVNSVRHFPGFTSCSAEPGIPDGGAMLPSGVFTLNNQADENFCIAVANSGKNSGDNVEVQRANGGNNQKWVLHHMGNGIYTIQNLNSGHYLDVPYGKTESGTNLWQCNYIGGTPQQWSLRDNGDGSYMIISKCNGLAVDMTNGGQPTAGQNIQCWECNTSSAQKWVLTRQAMISNGTYRITNAANPGYRLDINGVHMEDETNVHLWSAHDGDSQKFKFQADGEGYFTITNVATGKVLDAKGGGLTAGTNVQQYTSNGTDAQKWALLPYEGAYMLISKCNGLALDMSGGNAGNGINIQCWTLNWGTAQKWTLESLHEHTVVVDPGVAATCTTDGKTEGSHCSTCGEVLVAQKVIPASHTAVTDPAVAATCTTNGKTEGSHCSVCGKVLVAQQTVPAAHTVVTDSAVAATCTTAGKTEGSHCSVCGKVLVAQQTIPAKGHVAVTDPAVAATCTAAGKTEGSHCSVCGTVLVAQQTVAKLAHTPVTDPAIAATDSDDGLTEGSHCSVCGTVLVAQQTIPALNPGVDYNNVPSGVYTICNAASPNFCVDVSGASTANQANIHLWSFANGNNQKWILWSMGDGYYTIQSLHSGRYLDVWGQQSANGTNVWQYDYNGGPAQRWRIVNNGDGTCTFVSQCGNKALDINGGTLANGTNMQIWDRNGSNAQKWVLKPQAVLQDGVYTLNAKENGNYLVSVMDAATADGSNVAMAPNAFANHQRFAIQADGNGYYTIRATHTNKVLDVHAKGTANGTNIEQHSVNGGSNQKWLAVPYNGSYIFISKCNGLALDMNGGGQPTTGKNIQCWQLNWSTAQQWNLAPATIGLSGVYTIAASGDTNYALDISGVSTAQSANLHLWQNFSAANQKFVLEAFDDGYYGIRALHSGLWLNVDNNGMTNGTNVIQWGTTNAPGNNEKWSLIPNLDGTYGLVSKINGLYLDLSNNALTNGTNVQLWSHDAKTPAQKWVLKAVHAVLPDGTYSICSSANSAFVLDIDLASSNAHLWQNGNSQNQKFAFKHVGNGYYTITCCATGKLLGTANGLGTRGVNVCQTNAGAANAQLWRVLPNRDGTYTFINRTGDFALDTSNGKACNDNNVGMWTNNGFTAAQNWILK